MRRRAREPLVHRVAVGASAPTRAIASNVVTMTTTSTRTTGRQEERERERGEKRRDGKVKKAEPDTKTRVASVSVPRRTSVPQPWRQPSLCVRSFQNCTCNRVLRNGDAFSLLLPQFFTSSPLEFGQGKGKYTVFS